MDEITVVMINNPEKYPPFAKKYGILQEVMEYTAVINWNSNRGGICTNVSHGDYAIVPSWMWTILSSEVYIKTGVEYIPTGLKIWE